MLSATEIRGGQRRRRSPYSDKQHYHEYILQRIEGFKNSIGRDELMRLGDEAASELQTTSEGQFVLTEVLMLETVDRLIMKRLALRPYRRWREQFRKLRDAQRTPVHWGLDGGCALARLLPRIEAQRRGAGARRRRGAGHLPARGARRRSHLRGLRRRVRRAGGVAHGGRGAGESVRGLRRAAGPALPCFLEALEDVDVVVIDPNTLAGFKTSGPRRAAGRPAAAEPSRRRARDPGRKPRALARFHPGALRRVGRSRKSPCGASARRGRAAAPTASCSPSPRVPRTRRPRRSPRPTDTSGACLEPASQTSIHNH